jgi:hypothetical protein
MKKIQIDNKFTESVTCLPGGPLVVCMNNDGFFELFLTKINQFVSTVEDGTEKLDDSESEVSCGFGFAADRPSRSVTFNGDLTQVLKFCLTYKVLAEADKVQILEALKPPKDDAKKRGLLRWFSKKTDAGVTEPKPKKISFKNE